MTLPTEAVTLPGSGLVFLNFYFPNVTAAYQGAIIAAENALQSRFSDSVTISVQFDLQPLGSTFAAKNGFRTVNIDYATLVTAMAAHATTDDDRIAIAGLPAVDPSHGAGFAIPTSQARMLGLAPQSNSIDVSVALNSTLAWTYGQDAIGALEHEITEGGFGRVSTLGLQATRWAPLDLFRFSAAGVRDYTGGADGVPTFFGIDSGHVSTLPYHNAISASGKDDGSDLGDWNGTRGDAFGPGGPNGPGDLSTVDQQVLDVLGWTLRSAQPYVPEADDFSNQLADPSRSPGQLTPGAVVKGALQYAGDRDWFATRFYAGFTYTLSLTGQHADGGTIADPYLRLRDGGGVILAENDDIVSGTNPDSQIVFKASTGGTYYAEAGAFTDAYAGAYTLGLVVASNLPAALSTGFSSVLRVGPTSDQGAPVASAVSVGLAAGSLSQAQAAATIVAAAAGTTSVATLAYEFFTGRTPTAGGMDYLVSPTGPNPNNLNAAYYQSFSLENRYINFAVNLGKLGEGKAAFDAGYGGLDLFEATRKAYATIFGAAPSDAKLHALLDPSFSVDGQTLTRAQYFAYYGQDGAGGTGTKAAMVGWLLSEAVKADLGVYAHANDSFLTDIALNNAQLGVDLVGVYARPIDVYTAG